MAYRITLVSMQDQLRLRGCARREIQQQRVGGQRLAVWDELGIRFPAFFVSSPSGQVAIHNGSRKLSTYALELASLRSGGDDVAHAATVDSVLKIITGQ